MKKNWQSFQIIILTFLILVFLIVAPVLVFGLNTVDTGYTSFQSQTKKIEDLAAIGAANKCVVNNSTKDYFVPTKTIGEWNAFLGNLPVNVSTRSMCGPVSDLSCVDGVCSGSETYANCWEDCECDVACLSFVF
jgi:hypothetical protein